MRTIEDTGQERLEDRTRGADAKPGIAVTVSAFDGDALCAQKSARVLGHEADELGRLRRAEGGGCPA
jgi:hypothetical protein